MAHKTVIMIGLCCFSLGVFCSLGWTGECKVRILGIGNSFTVNSTKFLPQIFESDKDIDVDIAYAQIGGCSLERQVNTFTLNEKEPENKKGQIYDYKLNKKYKGKSSLKAVLQDGKWDYVTIQQVSTNSWKPETYRPYAKALYDYIKKYQPEAEVVFHETWAYEKDSPRLKSWGLTQQQMYDKLHSAYAEIANELDVKVIPVGTAMQNARKLPLWQYAAPDNVDIKSIVYPQKLPDNTNSLNVGYRWINDKKDKTKKVAVYDPHHANSSGEYLGGLVWYEFFVGKDARKVKFKPSGLSQERADSLKDIAHQTVAEMKAHK